MKKILFTLLVFLASFTFSLAASNPREKVINTYEDGAVKVKVYYYDSYLKSVTYFNNGNIEEIGYFNTNGERTGKWIMYNDKGNVISEANYKNGKKHGEWKIYNNEGQMTFYIVYKKGIRKSAFSWDEERGLIVKN